MIGMTPKWWKIYYSNGTFTSLDGSPFDAPRQDVQIIVQERDGTSYETVYGRDHFYWEEERGGWHTSDLFGAMDHLLRAKRQCLLFGRQLAEPEWLVVHTKVHEQHGKREHRYMMESSLEAGR